MINKKASHVGMIFSFVIFITFLLYIFSILSPLIFENNKNENLLLLVEQEVLSFLNVEVFRIVFTTSSGPSSGKSNNLYQVKGNDFNLCFDNYFVLVKDSKDVLFNFRKESCNVYFESSKDEIYSLYYSSYFLDESYLDSSRGVVRDVEINYFDNNKYYLESQIFNLTQIYLEDYSNLRKNFKIQDSVDFGFSFKFENGTIITLGEPFIDSEVFSKTINFNYYDAFLEKKKGELRIFVW